MNHYEACSKLPAPGAWAAAWPSRRWYMLQHLSSPAGVLRRSEDAKEVLEALVAHMLVGCRTLKARLPVGWPHSGWPGRICAFGIMMYALLAASAGSTNTLQLSCQPFALFLE